jgi:hypothetical protein
VRRKNQTGKVFYFERAECHGCRWFRNLSLEEKIAVPPTLSGSVIGACGRRRNIIMKGGAPKHCPYVEKDYAGEKPEARSIKRGPIGKIKVLGKRILGEKMFGNPRKTQRNGGGE